MSNAYELFKNCTDPSGSPEESGEFHSMESKQTRGWYICARILMSTRALVHACAVHMQVSAHILAGQTSVDSSHRIRR